MADVLEERKMIQNEETRNPAVAGESVMQRIAAAINFINKRQHMEKQFFANGSYGIMAAYPQIAVDGLVFFEFDAEIINVWAFNVVGGNSGTTELDIKITKDGGSSFDSIFTTTPKFTSSASNFSYVDAIGKQSAGSGVTAPVLDVDMVNVNAGDAIRLDIIQAMLDAQNCGIIIHYRPR